MRQQVALHEPDNAARLAGSPRAVRAGESITEFSPNSQSDRSALCRCTAVSPFLCETVHKGTQLGFEPDFAHIFLPVHRAPRTLRGRWLVDHKRGCSDGVRVGLTLNLGLWAVCFGGRYDVLGRHGRRITAVLFPKGKHQQMDEVQLGDGRMRQNKRVEVGLPHGA